MKQYLNQQKEIRHQEEVIAKLRSFNREKSIKRAESREKLLNKIEVLDRPFIKDSLMYIHLEPRITSGNDVLSVKHLSKAYDRHHLFSDLNFEIRRGERVALIGNNGTGKTTILKLLNGLIPMDDGEIRLGANVHVGYYDQEHQVLHMENTLFDEISDAYPNMNHTEIRNVLAAFLFTNDDVFKRIGDLSGGERGRVSLAKLMLSESNFLILDEPTNHLDITSKEILEDALNHYTGTVLYVSHDRYFINRTATRILNLTDQRLVNYIGNYDYYMEKKADIGQSSRNASGSAFGQSTRIASGSASGQSRRYVSPESGYTSRNTNLALTPESNRNTISGFNYGSASGSDGSASDSNNGSVSGSSEHSNSGSNNGSASGSNYGAASGSSTHSSSGSYTGSAPGTRTVSAPGPYPGPPRRGAGGQRGQFRSLRPEGPGPGRGKAARRNFRRHRSGGRGTAAALSGHQDPQCRRASGPGPGA